MINDRGYGCLLVEDATESYYPRPEPSSMVRAQGAIGGWTATVNEVLAALHGFGA